MRSADIDRRATKSLGRNVGTLITRRDFHDIIDSER